MQVRIVEDSRKAFAEDKIILIVVRLLLFLLFSNIIIIIIIIVVVVILGLPSPIKTLIKLIFDYQIGDQSSFGWRWYNITHFRHVGDGKIADC